MTIQPPPGKDRSSLDDRHRDSEEHDDDDHDDDDHDAGGGQVSEAGGASLNAETSAGGADALPDAHG